MEYYSNTYTKGILFQSITEGVEGRKIIIKIFKNSIDNIKMIWYNISKLKEKTI